MHIVAGLGSSAIYRLKRTWELVNQRPMATFTFLGNLMSPENNHALYRDALRLVGSPCVPFLGESRKLWVSHMWKGSRLIPVLQAYTSPTG